MRKFTETLRVPELQDGIRRSAAITQNQWYDFWTGGAVAAGAGSTERNVRLKYLSFDQATANEDIELRIIADNLDITLTQTAVAGQNYRIFIYSDPDGADELSIVAGGADVERTFLLEARALQIMYRKVTAAGANNTTIKGLHSQW